jgi:hypothetical protein
VVDGVGLLEARHVSLRELYSTAPENLTLSGFSSSHMTLPLLRAPRVVIYPPPPFRGGGALQARLTYLFKSTSLDPHH